MTEINILNATAKRLPDRDPKSFCYFQNIINNYANKDQKSFCFPQNYYEEVIKSSKH